MLEVFLKDTFAIVFPIFLIYISGFVLSIVMYYTNAKSGWIEGKNNVSVYTIGDILLYSLFSWFNIVPTVVIYWETHKLSNKFEITFKFNLFAKFQQWLKTDVREQK